MTTADRDIMYLSQLETMTYNSELRALQIAQAYRVQGELWYNLPVNIREDGTVEPWVRGCCYEAFTVSDNSELPALITLLGTIVHTIDSIRQAIGAGQPARAEQLIQAAHAGVLEAHTRLADLISCVGAYQCLADLQALNAGQLDEATRNGQGTWDQKVRWLRALPIFCALPQSN